MNRSKRSRLGVDSLILALASLALVGSLYAIIEDSDDQSTGSKSHQLMPAGKFVTSRNQVRRRVNAGQSWLPVKPSDTVFEGDTIFTGEDADASIDLTAGSRLIIDPKSLIVVRTQQNQVQIELAYGSLQGKVTENNTLALVDKEGKVRELKGQDAEVRIVKEQKAKETRVQVLKGQIAVREHTLPLKSAAKSSTGASGKAASNAPESVVEKIVQKDEVLQFEPQAAPVVKRLEAFLVSPSQGETLWLSTGKSIHFQWRVTGQPNETHSKASRIEVTRANDFSRPLYAREVNGDSLNLAFDPRLIGALSWRIKPMKDGSIATSPSRLTVYPDLAPVLSQPNNLETFKLDEETSRAVSLAWTDSAGSVEWQYEVARDSAFANIVESKRLNGLSARTAPLPPGKYYWRVMGLHPERPAPPWSQTQLFTIQEKITAPAAPELLLSRIDYEIPREILMRVPASMISSGKGLRLANVKPFTWKAPERAVAYEVEVSSDEAFSQSTRHVTSHTSFSLLEAVPGPHFVRVRAKDATGLVSVPSEVGRLQVFIPSPTLEPIRPESRKFYTQTDLDQAKHEFQVRWSRQPYASEYELEWSADSTFAQSSKTKVKGEKHLLPFTEARDYAVRVRGIASSGQPISSFSEPRIASFKKTLAPPPTPTPAEMSSVQVAPVTVAASTATAVKAKPEVAGLAMPRPTPTPLPPLVAPQLREPKRGTSVVSIENSASFVNFKWKAVTDAQGYTLQISKDAKFTTLLHNVKVQSNAFVLEKPLPEGRIFWRVQSNLTGRDSVWSETFDINVFYQ